MVITMKDREFFPDGTPVDEWFYNTSVPELKDLGKQYVLTEHNILPDGRIYTREIQALIDTAANNGGGVIVVPEGTFLTGALFFRQGVNLYVSEGGILKGSDDVSDYPILETRIEGETCPYFTALINADGIDGFTMCGKGTVDGNGMRAWKAFWLRREWNRACTNKDEQRPRLVYISNCSNVLIADLNLENSHYWTTHIYKCHHVKYLGCRISSPAAPVAAPSTDAIDIDACTDVLIKNCHMQVNDDAVALKGGKGPWADTLPENGINERIIIEDCSYGFCHSCLTCGSESVHNRNIIMRRIKVRDAYNLLWLKMRPDTPQRYEYITVEDIEGAVGDFIHIRPWTQFYDLRGREDIPLSYAENISMSRCKCECSIFFDVEPDEKQYILSDFVFRDLDIKAKENGRNTDCVQRITVDNVNIDA